MGLGSSTGIKDRVQRKLDKFDDIKSPEEAQAEVAILPLTAVHEARYAFQQLKEKYGNDEELFEILEPISRTIGWVEASAYFLNVVSQGDAMKSVLRGVLQGSQEYSQ